MESFKRQLQQFLRLRYLRGRLQVLQRPTVWGATIGILVLLIGISDYWHRQQVRSIEETSSTGVVSLDNLDAEDQPDSLPSLEDSAIAADIDTLPLLLNDFSEPVDGSTDNDPDGSSTVQPPDQDLSTPLVAAEELDATSSNPDNLPNVENLNLDLFSSDPVLDSFRRTNPFMPSLGSDGNSGGYRPIAPASGSTSFFSGSGTPPSTRSTFSGASSTNVLTSTPLQDALQRLGTGIGGDRALTTIPSQPSAAYPAASEFAQPGTAPGLGQATNLIPGNPQPGTGTTVQPFSSSPFWQTSPQPGTTGYTMPSILRSPLTPGSTGSSLSTGTGTLPGNIPTTIQPSSGNSYVDSFRVSPPTTPTYSSPQGITPPRPSYGSGVVYPSSRSAPAIPTPEIPTVPGYTPPYSTPPYSTQPQ